MLQEAFASLQMVELVGYEDELSEGAHHRGRSALIGMVARKPSANVDPMALATA
jgi:hypothetical protein